MTVKMIRKIRFPALLFGIVISSLLTLLGETIFAEENGSSDEFMLEEITVTAQKRSENQQKVPIAMEVITGEELTDLGKNNINDILDFVSGAIINKSSDGLRIALRGVSDDNLGMRSSVQSSTPTTALNKDGVYSNRKDSGSFLFDLDRVEVLFGPQSTLYASSSPAGVVNVVTAVPKIGEYEGSAQLEFGSYDHLHTEGTLNIPLNDTLALRAAFYNSVRDGYLSNGADDEDVKASRVRALYSPNEAISLLLTGEYSTSENYGISAVEEFGDQDDIDDPWTGADSSAGNEALVEQKKIYANMDFDLNFATVTVVPAYNENKYDATSTTVTDGTEVTTVYDKKSTEKSTEVRIASSENFHFKWIAGFVYYESADKLFRDKSDGSYYRAANTQESTAAYGNVTYPVMDAFRLTGGIRYTKEDNVQDTESYPPNPANPAGAVVHAENNYSNPDYKFGVEYDLSSSSMFYVDYSTSYRTQAYAQDADGNPFPAEKLKSYTIGTKNRFFNNRLQVNTSAYYYDYENYFAAGGARYLDQVDLNNDGDFRDTDLYDAESGEYRDETVALNDECAKQVGDARVYGIDIQTNTILSDWDRIDLSISYIKSEFTKLYFDFSDITNSQGVADLDYSGKDMPQSPEWTITARYSHQFHLENGSNLTAYLDAKYRSDYFLSYTDIALSMDTETYEPIVYDLSDVRYQEGYITSNISAVYSNPDGKYSITGYVNNIADYAVKTMYSQMGGGSGMLIIGEPRTYGIMLSLRF